MTYLFLIIVVAVAIAVLGVAAFTNFELDDAHYDRLKWIVIKWSALVTFVGLIAKTFDIPYGMEAVTVLAGIGALMAGLLGISISNWKLDQPQITFNEDTIEDMLEVDYEDTDEPTEEQ